MPHSPAYYEGVKHSRANLPPQCPYKEGSAEWKQWLKGYEQATTLTIVEIQVEELTPEEIDKMLYEEED